MAQVDPRDMLNNFCFHVYAQKSLILPKIAMLFLHHHRQRQHPLTLEFIELVPS